MNDVCLIEIPSCLNVQCTHTLCTFLSLESDDCHMTRIYCYLANALQMLVIAHFFGSWALRLLQQEKLFT